MKNCKPYYRLAFTLASAMLLGGCTDDSQTPSAGGGGFVEVEMTLVEVSGNAATVTFTPGVSTARYTYAIGVPADVGAFADGSFCGMVEVHSNDVLTVTFDDLEANSSYKVFARGEDEFGALGEVSALDVLTPEGVPQVAVAVLGVDKAGAKVSFVPNRQVACYEFAVGWPNDSAAFAAGTLGGTVTVAGGEPAEYVFPDLLPETQYAVFARGYDAAGNPGEVSALRVATPEYPWMYIELAEYNAMYVRANLSFNSVVTGVNWWSGPRSEYDLLCESLGGPEKLAAALRPRDPGEYELVPQPTNGDSTPKGDDYIFFAAFWTGSGVYDGYRVYQIPAYEYDPSLPVPSSASFKYSLVSLTESEIHVRVEFEPGTASVYAVPLTPEEYGRMSEDEIKASLFRPANWGTSSKTYFKEWIVQGMENWPGDKLIMAAVGCNANGTMGASEVCYAEFDLNR